MRIAVVAGPYVPIPPSKYGGAEQVISHLVKGLKEAGHEPILLASSDSTADCELIPIIPHALSFAKNADDFQTQQLLVERARENTSQALRKLMPTIDIIHSHGFDLKEFADFPNLTTLHNEIVFHGDNEGHNLDYYLDRTDLNYVSVSENQQASCPQLKYVTTVYNGEDPHEFPMVEQPDDYVCFLGRFDRKKNPHLAIELALQHGIKIKIAGKVDHESEGYFEQEIEPYLNNPHVEYLGELGFDEKVELLSRARCNLHPTSFREPFGLTVVEAAYCGTPTLAIARGSMPELIEFGRTGIWVEDFVEGYHRLEECFNMERRYVASRARQLFNYRAMTKKYVAAYKTVLAEMTAPARSHLQPEFSRWVVNRSPGARLISKRPLPLLRMKWHNSGRQQSAH